MTSLDHPHHALTNDESSNAYDRCTRSIHGLPLYAPNANELSKAQRELIETVRAANAIIVATPGYHGGISGLVRNALDTLEALRDDERPYQERRAVGSIVTAYGWQARS